MNFYTLLLPSVFGWLHVSNMCYQFLLYSLKHNWIRQKKKKKIIPFEINTSSIYENFHLVIVTNDPLFYPQLPCFLLLGYLPAILYFLLPLAFLPVKIYFFSLGFMLYFPFSHKDPWIKAIKFVVALFIYRKMLHLQYFYNIFTTNHMWLVVIGSNFKLMLKLLFCPNNNN